MNVIIWGMFAVNINHFKYTIYPDSMKLRTLKAKLIEFVKKNGNKPHVAKVRCHECLSAQVIELGDRQYTCGRLTDSGSISQQRKIHTFAE